MKLSVDEFTHWEHKSITLLGMSGVGKTFLSNILRSSDWFHYSGDYRIGTRYLNEPILDNIKQQAMQVPFIRDLLRSDSIYIQNNITVDHLKPISSFLGKLGNPEQGGLSLQEFKRRQNLHLNAEIAAMQDVPEFIRKAHEIYGFNNFINDAGGSVSELNSPEVIQTLSEHTLILYIKATEENEKALIERAKSDPKPLYYQEAFLDQYLEIYMTEQNIDYVSMLDPDAFVRWVFPYLFKARLPRYDAIAKQYGYTVSTTELYQIKTEADFVDLVAKAVARQQ
ncbi:MAG TPA: ATPase [Thiothrix sp.]|nr:ATPase [Thiothrix sp.]